MRYEIIYTNRYAVIVNDEPIKHSDYCLAQSEDGIYDNEVVQYSMRPCPPPMVTNKSILKKIIAHTPLNDNDYLEGVNDLPSFYRSHEDGVIQEARQYLQDKGFSGHANHSLVPKWMAEFYEMGRERYSLSLDKLIELYVEKTGYGMDMWSKEENETMSTIAEIIESLQKTRMPVAIELVCMGEMFVKVDENGTPVWYEVLVPATIEKNGRQQVVGQYIYENK